MMAVKMTVLLDREKCVNQISEDREEDRAFWQSHLLLTFQPVSSCYQLRQ